LLNAEALAKKLAKAQPDAGMPAALHGNREAMVLYNNLADILVQAGEPFVMTDPVSADGDEQLQLALKLDVAVKTHAPADWRGDQARESQVLNAIYPILNKNKTATLAVFELVKNQPGY